MALFPRESGAANRVPLVPYDPKSPTLERSMYNAVDQLRSLLAGRLTVGAGGNGAHAGNFDWQEREFVSGLATKPFDVPHGLGRTPRGYIVIYQNFPASLYADTSRGWTDEMVYLVSDTDTVTFRVLLI